MTPNSVYVRGSIARFIEDESVIYSFINGRRCDTEEFLCKMRDNREARIWYTENHEAYCAYNIFMEVS